MTLRPGRALLLLVALAGAPGARADFAPLGIEIDGDHVDAPGPPAEDWFPRFPPRVDPVGSDDDTLCGTSPAPKNDIAQYFLANDLDHLYVAFERLTNNGNTSFFLEVDVAGDGPSRGDFIFVFCFGSGAVVTETYVLEWDAAAGEWVQDATPPVVAFAVNTTRIATPFGTLDEHGRPSSVLDAGRFAEARIALAEIEGFDPCAADDVVAEMESKSSCSLSSECKDTTGPFAFSFDPLEAALELAQAPDCTPSLQATAHAVAPRGAVTYRWFLDGVEITGLDPSWSTSDSITIDVGDACGPTEVRVVVDDGTCTVEDVAVVDVDRRPVAVIGGLAVGACDQVLAFDANGSTDCNGATLAYLWDFDSDGTVDATTASGTHALATCGDRLVTLRVADGACVSDPVFRQVAVNGPPLAALQVVPTGCLGIDWLSASTDCDLVHPPSSGSETLAFALDFGDGSPPATSDSGEHAYAACGTYVLTLTVTDASGCASSDERVLTLTGVVDAR